MRVPPLQVEVSCSSYDKDFVFTRPIPDVEDAGVIASKFVTELTDLGYAVDKMIVTNGRAPQWKVTYYLIKDGEHFTYARTTSRFDSSLSETLDSGKAEATKDGATLLRYAVTDDSINCPYHQAKLKRDAVAAAQAL